jgi:hypothetical protein
VIARRLAAAFLVVAVVASQPALAAVNSYRFLHVTINTPWQLFLFLLVGVLSPFLLMAVLLWRNAFRRDRPPAPAPLPAAPQAAPEARAGSAPGDPPSTP